MAFRNADLFQPPYRSLCKMSFLNVPLGNFSPGFFKYPLLRQPGLYPITKNYRNFKENWPNFLFSGNSYRFSNCVLRKKFWQFFQESVHLSAPKNLARSFLVFQKKFVGFKIFWFSKKNACLSQKNFRT